MHQKTTFALLLELCVLPTLESPTHASGVYNTACITVQPSDVAMRNKRAKRRADCADLQLWALVCMHYPETDLCRLSTLANIQHLHIGWLALERAGQCVLMQEMQAQ